MKAKPIEAVAAENHKYPLAQLMVHHTGMAMHTWTGTLRAGLLPQLSAKDLALLLQQEKF